MIVLIKRVGLVCLLLLSAIGYAQDDDTDFSTWGTIELEYKLKKKWGFGLQEQLRLKNNSSEIDKYFTQLDVNYKFFKNFKLGVGGRYIRENDNVGKVQGYENYFRFQVDAIYNHELNNFSLSYRLRYQNKNEIGIPSEDRGYATQNFRLKTAIGYNINKWPLDPKFSAEIFNRFKEDKDNEFNKFRLTCGTSYDMKKYGKIKLFYRFEQEINKDEPETTNIVGLKYTYSLSSK